MQDKIDKWFALLHFDKWVLQPRWSSANHTTPITTSADGTTSILGNTEVPIPNTNILTLPFPFSIQRTHNLSWQLFINGMV
jgi:hypothetical protein